MEYLILYLVICALFHFVYERIIAPSLRCELRYRFFAVRDELRRAKVQLGDTFTEDAYELLQEVSNNALHRLHRLELMTLWAVYCRLNSDPGFLKAVKEQRQRTSNILDHCPAQEARALNDRISHLFDEAFYINSFGWAFYLFPLIIVFLLFPKIRTLITHALFAPDLTFDSVAGSPDTARGDTVTV